MQQATLNWWGIVRLGLVQTSLGAIVVLMTSTINRVMVVEVGLPAFVPGLLVGSHYFVQILRPAWGYGSDVGGQRTPWIIGGMALLASSGTLAAYATTLADHHPVLGIGLAFVAFLFIGFGVGAAGTSVLTVLATHVAPERRAAAATTVWVMMIFGFALTAPLAGHFLDPFSYERLIVVTACVSSTAFITSVLAIWGVEQKLGRRVAHPAEARPSFITALKQIWREPQARRLTIFIFISMLAYSAQELIIEPFAGIVFSMTPGSTTKLAGVQHGGVLAGMLMVAFLASVVGGPILGSLRNWTVGGCVASAITLLMVGAGGFAGPDYPLRPIVFLLGVSNGAFAVAAIGSMMSMAGSGAAAREGTRIGLWGAAQAIAFGLGGFLGASVVDVARHATGDPSTAFGIAFGCGAITFLASAVLAWNISAPAQDRRDATAGSLSGTLIDA